MKSYWYFLFVGLILAVWAYVTYPFSGVYNTSLSASAPIVMMLGSFIAGVSSEGGGAVAFPVFTLVFDLSPAVARNFSFAIQSVGMTAAALLLIDLRTALYRPAILWGGIGGITGLIIGTILPQSELNMGLTKLIFVSIWLSFGITLYRIFFSKKAVRGVEKKVSNGIQNRQLLYYGIVGGVITAFFGNGIDILIFSALVLKFNVDVKTATATSIVLMTLITIAGFFIHIGIVKDFGTTELNLWLACIPVVLFGAPLGSYVLKRSNARFILIFLITIICIQFVGALIVLKPSAEHICYSVIAILGGLFLFNWGTRGNIKA